MSTSRTVAENTAAGQNIQHPVSATDPENTTLTYSLEGQDKDAFDTEPDWTKPDWVVLIKELHRDRTYEVQVRAKNDEGESEWSPSAKATISNRWRNLLDTLYLGTTAPEVVDDLRIYVEIVEINGEGGTLGQAGPDVWRIPSSMPIASRIELDKDDLGTMSHQELAAVILHEIGHTLGIGLGPWRDHNLLQNPSLVYGNRIVPAPDTYFSGTNAIAAFNDAGGSSYTGEKVPTVGTRLAGQCSDAIVRIYRRESPRSWCL